MVRDELARSPGRRRQTPSFGETTEMPSWSQVSGSTSPVQVRMHVPWICWAAASQLERLTEICL